MASLSREKGELYRIHWRFRVLAGPETGVVKSGSLQLGRCTRASAKRKLREVEDWEESVKDGRHVPDQRFQTISARWLQERALDCTPQTVRRMQQVIDLYTRWRRSRRMNCDELEAVARRDDISAWRDYRLDHEAVRKTVANDLSTLSSLFGWCAREGYLRENPVERVTRPRFVARKEGTPLTRIQAGRWLRGIRPRKGSRGTGPWNWDEVRRKRQLGVFLLNTGLRNGELCSADLEDLRIDTEEQMLFVTGKGLKQRWIPLNRAALATVRSHLRARGWPTKGPLFVTCSGERYNERQLSNELTQTKRAAGEELQVNPHNLRHTFATWMAKSGVDSALLQKVLGHENVNTTFAYYVHTCDSELAGATRCLRPRRRAEQRSRPAENFRVIPFPQRATAS